MFEHPGTFVEEISSGVLGVEAAPTSTAVLLGSTKRGPVGEPVLVSSFAEFATKFGGLHGAAGDMRDEPDKPDKPDKPDRFGLAVQAFFANGGATAYIVNVGQDTLGLAEYRSAFEKLRHLPDASIMLLPDLNWIERGDNSILQAAVSHAELMRNRMVVIDPPDSAIVAKRLDTSQDVEDLGLPTSPNAVLYYPWLEVTNPVDDPDSADGLPPTFSVPPSAFAAGIWARSDSRRGVWKAPAGLEATVQGAIGLTVEIGDDVQDTLHEHGVNCLRSINGSTVVWGARTLASRTQPESRYVAVCRTRMMISDTFDRVLQTVVFEPNGQALWARLRTSATNFLESLFRAGAFQGEKASDAYIVQCGLGTTMTQADIDAGLVRIVVGFAPLKPAEFVVVQLEQVVGQTA